MRRSRAEMPTSSLTGALNKRAGTGFCLLLAAFCAYQALQTDAYTKALDTGGITVQGEITGQTLRPCMFSDLCNRKNSRDLTHVGFATVAYTDPAGIRHQTRKPINNATARRHKRGTSIRVTFPKHDATNTSFGNPAYNRRSRVVEKLLLALGALALIVGAFWIYHLPDYELADGRKPANGWGSNNGDFSDFGD